MAARCPNGHTLGLPLCVVSRSGPHGLFLFAIGRKSHLPPFLYCFAMFVHDPVPDDSNELCIVSHTSGTVTAEATSVVGLPSDGFHPTKTHPGSGNHYAETLLCSNWLRIDFEYTYGKRCWDQLCVISLSLAQNGPEARITCAPYWSKPKVKLDCVFLTNVEQT